MGQQGQSKDMPVPKMVVEKVDLNAPSHGDIPGTAAHAKRQADAVPDVILQASERDSTSTIEDRGSDIRTEVPIPTTVITKVDSIPSHGEIPGTDAFDMRKGDAKPDIVEKKGDISGKSKTRCWVLSSEPMTESDRSKLSKPKRTKPPIENASPIAADGGFGPMSYEVSEDESLGSNHDEASNDTEADTGEGFGDDFDDFEAGAENEDFGDFDEGFEQAPIINEEPPEAVSPPPLAQSLPPSISPFVSETLSPNIFIMALLYYMTS